MPRSPADIKAPHRSRTGRPSCLGRLGLSALLSLGSLGPGAALLSAGSGARLAQAQPSSAPIPAGLPETIAIKTPSLSFNSRYDYALLAGRIWYRPHLAARDVEPAARRPARRDWTLMPCQGLPCNPAVAAFPVPRAITAISADGDELTALDDQGRFYFRTMAGPGWLSKTEWTQLSGFPKAQLSLTADVLPYKAWSMGRRHFDVLWHEDADGNPHHVGTTGTSSLYLLTGGGDVIRFSDNGLPADFSHRICGPERGTIRLENLQASAATLFAIDAAGQSYTVMSDFDINGGTSMFINYTYTPQAPYRQPAGSDFASHLRPWRLPPEAWRRQPAIPLRGLARLSSEITILQTGRGNAARELRIAGLDAQGRQGYYHKPIFAPAWSFRTAAHAVAPGHWLQPGAQTRLPDQDRRYVGRLDFGSGQVYAAELLDFNLDCSPARLRLSLPGGPAELRLHTVDAWTHARCGNPGRDGTAMFKLGTLEAAPAQLAGLPAPLRALQLHTFALPLAASLERVYIFASQGELLGELVSPSEQLQPALSGPLAKSRLRALGSIDALHLLEQQPDLSLDLAELDIQRLQALIAADLALLERLAIEYDLLQAAQQQAWLEALGTALLHSVYLGTGMCWWMAFGPAFCHGAPELMTANYVLESELVERLQLRYRQAMLKLRFRLERYRERLSREGADAPQRAGGQGRL